MKETWSYANPTKLYYGEQWLSKLPEFVESLSKDAKVGIITGQHAARKYGYTQSVLDSLSGKECVVFDEVEPEPSHDTVMKGKDFFERHQVSILIAIGGGSSIDAAKAMSCLAYTQLHITPIMDREIVITEKKIPLIAIPTTAGSGSEITPFSVLTNTGNGLKKSTPSPYFYPDLAIVMPRFLTTLPKKVIGDVGMDALAHSFEALWSIHSNQVSDAIAFKAIKLISDNFLTYYCDPQNYFAASAMAVAATLAGKSFSNTFTAACHGLSYPIGRRFNLSHGASCAMTLHLVARFNQEVMKEKFVELAQYLNLPGHGDIHKLIEDIRTNITTVPSFRELSANIEDLRFIAQGAFRPLLDNNPIKLSEDQIVNLLAKEL